MEPINSHASIGHRTHAGAFSCMLTARMCLHKPKLTDALEAKVRVDLATVVRARVRSEETAARRIREFIVHKALMMCFKQCVSPVAGEIFQRISRVDSRALTALAS
jgi:hypothetical protein